MAWRTKGMIKNVGVLVSNLANSYRIDLSNVGKYDHDKMAIIPGIVSCVLPPVIRKMWFNIESISSIIKRVTLNVSELVEDPTVGFWVTRFVPSRSFACHRKTGMAITSFTVEGGEYSYTSLSVTVAGSTIFNGRIRVPSGSIGEPVPVIRDFGFESSDTDNIVFTLHGAQGDTGTVNVSYYTYYYNDRELTTANDNVELNCLVIGD